ncbi:cupin domain-containing protein [Niallia sp. 03133]|uniref:cupin domain-containing protein n=1 Tax=Niallia sp. 03133 TaxID=3458060 RepID=UPI004043AD67
MSKKGQLEVINLLDLIKEQKEYTNFIVSEINNHALRIAVIDGEFHWHKHEDCDELFYVLEGELFIDLEGETTVSLKPGEVFTVPANTMHRTRSNERTVNICFEKSTNDIKGS